MTFELIYKVANRVRGFLTKKRAVVTIAVLAPVVFSLSALYLGGYLNYRYAKPKAVPIVVSEVPQVKSAKTSAFEDNLKPIYGSAKSLDIPSLKIDINLVEVGLDDAGTLQTPKNWNEGGWYKYSSRPGEKGNVIVNAHYDDHYGRPAAFWQLKNIKPGDTVLLLDKYGKDYTYSVKDSFLVSINDPDRLRYFESQNDKSTLTLVTCGGIWVPGKSTYDKRLVVQAELDPSKN